MNMLQEYQVNLFLDLEKELIAAANRFLGEPINRQEVRSCITRDTEEVVSKWLSTHRVPHPGPFSVGVSFEENTLTITYNKNLRNLSEGTLL